MSKKKKIDIETEMLFDLKLREEAMCVLEKSVHENSLKKIRKDLFLDHCIVDAIIKFHYKQIENDRRSL